MTPFNRKVMIGGSTVEALEVAVLVQHAEKMLRDIDLK
jgi:hypothetical protein